MKMKRQEIMIVVLLILLAFSASLYIKSETEKVTWNSIERLSLSCVKLGYHSAQANIPLKDIEEWISQQITELKDEKDSP